MLRYIKQAAIPVLLGALLGACTSDGQPAIISSPEAQDQTEPVATYPPRVCPPVVGSADGSLEAEIWTWNDTDGDGEMENGEPSLPWVTINVGYETFTSPAGRASIREFKPGCSCNCGQGDFVSVSVPAGYEATTITKHEMMRPDETYRFGFRRIDGLTPPEFSGEPNWYHAFVNRGFDIAGFHYAPEQNVLEIEWQTPAGFDVSSFDSQPQTTELFAILYVLERDDFTPAFAAMKLTLIPAKHTLTCNLKSIRDGVGPSFAADHCKPSS